MPKASKETASETVEVEGYEGHLEKVDGGFTIGFETYTDDADLSIALSGCPRGRIRRAAMVRPGPGPEARAHLISSDS